VPKFAKGQRGNPAGRPKGSKHKIKQDFIDALQDDFEVHGAKTFIKARETDPIGYLRIVAGLFPKEEEHRDDFRGVRFWTEAEWLAYQATQESSKDA
jgi:Family of unknown function (DUF5681)